MIVEVCEADCVTPTNRMYSKEILQAQVERLTPVIEARAMVGELGPVTESIIHFNNVSHAVDKLWLDGNKLMASISILDTPAGKTLGSVLSRNREAAEFKMVGVGSGRVDNNGVLQVGDSYKLVQIEAILSPTHSNN